MQKRKHSKKAVRKQFRSALNVTERFIDSLCVLLMLFLRQSFNRVRQNVAKKFSGINSLFKRVPLTSDFNQQISNEK